LDEGLAVKLALGLVLSVLLVLIIRECLQFGAWLIPIVLLINVVLFFTAPVSFLAWQFCFFYGTARWKPVRGLYRLPRWPRNGMRGPGGRRRREFREPMPWTRGPGSY